MNRLAWVMCCLMLVSAASACTDCTCTPDINNEINISNILTQITFLSVQQSQAQQQSLFQYQRQEQKIITAPMSGWSTDSNGQENKVGISQESKTYSRLVYPGEVLTIPAKPGDTCYLYAGLPVAFYTINSGNGTFSDQVQTLESVPEYDPVYHRMNFGMTPVIDRIDYWTMKAEIILSPDADFCVIDNRANFNSYTTIEVIVVNGV